LNNTIHSSAILEGDVQLGSNIIIGANSYIKGPVFIQDNVIIGVNCVIGTAAEHNKKPSQGSVFIGANTQITDCVVIHKGTDEIQTTIGKHCYIMNQSYIAHDCKLEDRVVLSSHVSLAGAVQLQTACNLGLGVAVHQFTIIGAHAMVGMLTPVTKHVPPFVKVYGNPARIHTLNTHAFAANNINTQLVSLNNGLATMLQANDYFDAAMANFKITDIALITKMAN
jgi:UDP-N-acetylglucosamine acyltransferase